MPILICSYITPTQKKYLNTYLKDTSIHIYSSFWLYDCIDHSTFQPPITTNKYDSIIYQIPEEFLIFIPYSHV